MTHQDIYDDLHNLDLGDKINQLEERNKKLLENINLLQNDVQKLCQELTQMKRTEDNLKNNISKLFATAKLEIDRKNKTIADLQNKLDDLTFRRRRHVSPNFSSRNKNIEENRRKRKAEDDVETNKKSKVDLHEEIGDKLEIRNHEHKRSHSSSRSRNDRRYSASRRERSRSRHRHKREESRRHSSRSRRDSRHSHRDYSSSKYDKESNSKLKSKIAKGDRNSPSVNSNVEGNHEVNEKDHRSRHDKEDTKSMIEKENIKLDINNAEDGTKTKEATITILEGNTTDCNGYLFSNTIKEDDLSHDELIIVDDISLNDDVEVKGDIIECNDLNSVSVEQAQSSNNKDNELCTNGIKNIASKSNEFVKIKSSECRAKKSIQFESPPETNVCSQDEVASSGTMCLTENDSSYNNNTNEKSMTLFTQRRRRCIVQLIP